MQKKIVNEKPAVTPSKPLVTAKHVSRVTGLNRS